LDEKIRNLTDAISSFKPGQDITAREALLTQYQEALLAMMREEDGAAVRGDAPPVTFTGIESMREALAASICHSQTIMSDMGLAANQVLVNLFSQVFEAERKALDDKLSEMTPDPSVIGLSEQSRDKLRSIFLGCNSELCAFLQNYNSSYNKDSTDPDFLEHAANCITLHEGTVVASPNKLAMLLAHPQYWNVVAKEMSVFAEVPIPDSLEAESVAAASSAHTRRFSEADRIIDYLIAKKYLTAPLPSDTLRLFVRDFYIITKKTKGAEFDTSILQSAIEAVQHPKLKATSNKDVAAKIEAIKDVLIEEVRAIGETQAASSEAASSRAGEGLCWSFVKATRHLLPEVLELTQDSLEKTLGAVTISVLDDDTSRLGYPEAWQGAYIGHLTNCCQSIGSPGEDSVRFGLYLDNCGVIAIRKGNKILAQSLYWIDAMAGKAIVLDSFEMSGPENAKYFAPLLGVLGERLRGKGIELLAGKGGGTPSIGEDVSRSMKLCISSRGIDSRASASDSWGVYNPEFLSMEAGYIGLWCLANKQHARAIVEYYLDKKPERVWHILINLCTLSIRNIDLMKSLWNACIEQKIGLDEVFTSMIKSGYIEFLEYIISPNQERYNLSSAYILAAKNLDKVGAIETFNHLCDHYEISNHVQIQAFVSLLQYRTNYEGVDIFLRKTNLSSENITKALIEFTAFSGGFNVVLLTYIIDNCEQFGLGVGEQWCDIKSYKEGWYQLLECRAHNIVSLEKILRRDFVLPPEAIDLLFHVIYKDQQSQLFYTLCDAGYPLPEVPLEFLVGI